jgi:hypothetical protein
LEFFNLMWRSTLFKPELQEFYFCHAQYLYYGSIYSIYSIFFKFNHSTTVFFSHHSLHWERIKTVLVYSSKQFVLFMLKLNLISIIKSILLALATVTAFFLMSQFETRWLGRFSPFRYPKCVTRNVQFSFQLRLFSCFPLIYVCCFQDFTCIIETF